LHFHESSLGLSVSSENSHSVICIFRAFWWPLVDIDRLFTKDQKPRSDSDCVLLLLDDTESISQTTTIKERRYIKRSRGKWTDFDIKADLPAIKPADKNKLQSARWTIGMGRKNLRKKRHMGVVLIILQTRDARGFQIWPSHSVISHVTRRMCSEFLAVN